MSGNYACRSPWSFATESKVLGRTHHWLEPPTGSLYHYWPLDANGSNQYYTYKKFWSYSAPGSQYWWVVVEGTDPTGSSSYGSVYCWQ
ncbi:MAG: hypothetical protein OSA99_14960 [Acidimicrobiales bacterium]|nr:hypothetical protein [Acidimicrobiales bacterium]